MLRTGLNDLQLIGALVVGTVTVVRVGLLGQSPNSRLLWIAMASLAIGQSLQVEGVYRWLENAVGVPGSAAVIKHSAALFAAANTAAVVDLLLPEDRRAAPRHTTRRRTWIGLGAAVSVATLPWVIDPPAAVPRGLAHRAEYYDTSWRSIMHWAAFLSYLGWALISASRLCWHYRRVERHRPTLVGVSLVGAGTSIGLGYIIEKAVVVIAWATDQQSAALILFDQASEAAVLALSVSLIAIGTGWEAGHAWLSRRHHEGRIWRDVQPFLTRIRGEFPQLRPPAALTSASERIVSAVALISEGLRRLTAYAPPPTRSEADDAAVRQFQQAAWLREALARKARGQTPSYPVTAPPVRDSGRSVETARDLTELYRRAQMIETTLGAGSD